MKVIKATLLSVLIFFSISFLQVLKAISPTNNMGSLGLQLGCPFNYYDQFYIGHELHHGWHIKNLLIDIALVWMLTVALYLIVLRYNKKT